MRRFRSLIGTGLIAAVIAMALTTMTALLVLHLVAATVMIPTLARSLGALSQVTTVQESSAAI